MPELRMPRLQRAISITFNSLESAEATRDRFRSSGYTDLSVIRVGSGWIMTGTPPPRFTNRSNQYLSDKPKKSHAREEDDWAL